MSIRGLDVGDLPEWLLDTVRTIASQMAEVVDAEDVSAADAEERIVDLSR